jgi:hypothetical protein
MTMNEPRDAYTVKRAILRDVDLYRDDLEFSQGHKGAMIGNLNEYLGGDAIRHIVLSWIFCNDPEFMIPISSKELRDKQWYGLYRWIDSYQDENGEWHVAPNFPQEATWVATCAMLAYSKTNAVVRDELFDPPPEIAAKIVEMGGVIQKITEDNGEGLNDMPDVGNLFVEKDKEF